MQTKTKWILGILFVAVVLTGVYFSDLSLQKGALVLKPDLTVKFLSMTPQIVREGDVVTFNVEIKNRGMAGVPLGTGAVVELKIDNISVPPYPEIGALPPAYGTAMGGGNMNTVQKSLTWTATSQGSHSINICADSTNAIPESRETNNCTTGSVNVFEPLPPPAPAPTADLEKFNFQAARDSNQIKILLSVKNKGGAYSSPEQVKVRIYPTNVNNTIYPAYVIEKQIPILAPNQWINVETLLLNGWYASVPWTDAQLNGIQATKIKVEIDWDNALPETNETNNSAEVNIPPPQLSAAHKPDLIIEGGVGVSPVQLTVGNTAIISAVIKNQGGWQSGTSTVGMSADLAETVTPHAYLLINDAPVSPYATLGNPPISPGQTRSASLPWTASSSGSYSVKICALNPPENLNPAIDVRAESNTDNNCAPGPTITVQALPNEEAPQPPTAEAQPPEETPAPITEIPPEDTFQVQEQGMNALLLVPLFEKAPRIPVRQRTDRELSLQACVDKSTPEERSLCARTVGP